MAPVGREASPAHWPRLPWQPVVTGPPAAAAVQTKTRTDSFAFTVSGTTTQVTCSFTSTLQYDTETQVVTASTAITGTERPECRASLPEVT